MAIGERFELEKDEELRIEVELLNKEEHIFVELLTGLGEIFATEMVIGTKYKFNQGAKFSVYTYHGCSLMVYGRNEVAPYKSKEHPMIQYVNVHSALEKMRTAQDKGPVVMVVGPTDVGKSTLCRLFVNYAVRQGRRPIFVDLDVSQCCISVPGVIGATLVERPASIEDGFPVNAPLAYQYGHMTPGHNPVLYNNITSRMADVVRERLKINKKAEKSGVVINTYGFVRGEGYTQLKHVAQAFEVDVIIVLDQERVYNDLVRDMPKFVKVIWQPKSNGVVERTPEQRMEGRDLQLKQYFYGPHNNLFPHSYDIRFADLKGKIYKIGAPTLPDSCMPLGNIREHLEAKAP